MEHKEVGVSRDENQWDQIQLFLPDPVWEKLYDEEACLVYEGYTLDHKAYGAGRVFFGNGTVSMEGLFRIKGFLCGKVFSGNGTVMFEGMFRLNLGYGPNNLEYGARYDSEGKLLYHGKFGVSRSGLGWPKVNEPIEFGTIPQSTRLKGKVFMREDARRLMKTE